MEGSWRVPVDGFGDMLDACQCMIYQCAMEME